MTNKYRNEVWLSQRETLTERNVKLQLFNEYVDGLIPSESKVYPRADSIENPEKYELMYQVERLSSIQGTAFLLDHRQFL